jgi:hypothetical protein
MSTDGVILGEEAKHDKCSAQENAKMSYKNEGEGNDKEAVY